MRRWSLIGMLLVAFLVGGLIAWIDSRPGWDDTGITVGLLVLVCAGFGALQPARAWLWALAVGIWLPLVEIALTGHLGSLVAIAIAFAGAYAGALARRLVAGDAQAAAGHKRQ